MSTKITGKEQFFRQVNTESGKDKQTVAGSQELSQTDKNLIREQNNLLGSLRRLNMLNQSGKINPETAGGNPQKSD